MKAAEKNLTEIALALISAGADVNIADKVRKLLFLRRSWFTLFLLFMF